MIKAILFDFDDTLVKTKAIRYKALKEAGKTFYNIDITDQDIDNYWGQPFNLFISGIFRNLASPEVLTENYKSILHKYPNEPFEGTNSTLDILKHKYLLGIISSSNPDLIKSGMENTKIDPEIFFFIQSSFDTDVHKPNPDVFLPSLERLRNIEVNKHEIIYIGDALDDYVSSKSAGIRFCAIAERTVSVNVFINQKIPYIMDFKKLPEFINNLK